MLGLNTTLARLNISKNVGVQGDEVGGQGGEEDGATRAGTGTSAGSGAGRARGAGSGTGTAAARSAAVATIGVGTGSALTASVVSGVRPISMVARSLHAIFIRSCHRSFGWRVLPLLRMLLRPKLSVSRLPGV